MAPIPNWTVGFRVGSSGCFEPAQQGIRVEGSRGLRVRGLGVWGLGFRA